MVSATTAAVQRQREKENVLLTWLIGTTRESRKNSLLFYTFTILFVCIFCANCEYLGTEYIQYGTDPTCEPYQPKKAGKKCNDQGSLCNNDNKPYDKRIEDLFGRFSFPWSFTYDMRKQQEEFKTKAQLNDQIWDMFNLPFSQAAMTWAYARQIFCFVFSLTGQSKTLSFFVLPIILSLFSPIVAIGAGPLSILPGLTLMPSVPPFSLLVYFLPYTDPVTKEKHNGLIGWYIKACGNMLEYWIPWRSYLKKTADAHVIGANKSASQGQSAQTNPTEGVIVPGAAGASQVCGMICNLIGGITWIMFSTFLLFGGIFPIFAIFVGLAITFTVSFLIAPTTFIQSVTIPILYMVTVVVVPFLATGAWQRILNNIVSKWKYLIPIWLIIAVYTAYNTYRNVGMQDTGSYVAIGMIVGIVIMYLMGIYYKTGLVNKAPTQAPVKK